MLYDKDKDPRKLADECFSPTETSRQAALKATISLPWELWHALLHYDSGHQDKPQSAILWWDVKLDKGHLWHLGIRGHVHHPFTDGWRNPPHRLLGRQFWCAEFAQRRTGQTRWRRHLCCPRPPSLSPVAARVELHLSSGSVENCGQTAAWVPSGSGWHSSPEFWTGWENKTKKLHNISTPIIFTDYKGSDHLS